MVTWQKGQTRDPNTLRAQIRIISKTAGDRDSAPNSDRKWHIIAIKVLWGNTVGYPNDSLASGFLADHTSYKYGRAYVTRLRLSVWMYCGYTVRRREKVAIVSLYDVV